MENYDFLQIFDRLSVAKLFSIITFLSFSWLLSSSSFRPVILIGGFPFARLWRSVYSISDSGSTDGSDDSNFYPPDWHGPSGPSVNPFLIFHSVLLIYFPFVQFGLFLLVVSFLWLFLDRWFLFRNIFNSYVMLNQIKTILYIFEQIHVYK